MKKTALKAFGGIQSDKLYSSTKPTQVTNTLYSEAANQAYYDAVTGIEYEIELDKRAIAATIRVYAADDTANGRWNPLTTKRVVFLGEFSFKKGNIASARIDSIGVGNLGRRGNDSYYSAFIAKPASDKVDNPGNIASWGSSSLWDTASILSRYDQNPISTQGMLPEITTFGGGKFFYSGWESNPFSTNLI